MARLIVEARTGELTGVDVVYRLLLAVSVSRADNGFSVTGLKAKNFRVASFVGLVKDFEVVEAYEQEWEPKDIEPSGCYELHIVYAGDDAGEKFTEGARYHFGVQARTFSSPGVVVDRGQTVIELISEGT